jgi:ATP-dependent Clp protease ATP-binding subunit ClpA
MPLPPLSLRATKLLIEARHAAGARGAEFVDANDLILAAVLEDQDPNSLDLNEQHPEVKKFAEMQPTPKGVLFRRDCALTKERLFEAEIAGELLRKIHELHRVSSAVPDNRGIPVSEGFTHAMEAAEKLRDGFHQSKITALHILIGAMRQPCEAARLLQENGITEEKVQALLSAGPEKLNALLPL